MKNLNDKRLAYLPIDESIESPANKEFYPDLVEAEAERGIFKSMCTIAYMYAKGLGVKQDYEKAFKWFLEAAESGQANAQYNLGVMYINGDVKNKTDYKKACRWLRKAAEQDFEQAKQLLDRINTAE
ncbi:MAG: sel1 repeat family protein [Treponema sp.]|nr:sel1 repeat family protein [Treponema sp.]